VVTPLRLPPPLAAYAPLRARGRYVVSKTMIDLSWKAEDKACIARALPSVRYLSAAVLEVIDSNRRDGYIPTRFIGITQHGTAPNLLQVCRNLMNPATMEWLETGLEAYPTCLFVEDFVSRFGADWSFDQEVINEAKARSERFDQVAGAVRYTSPTDVASQKAPIPGT
jgi:hypothetical protein